MSRANSGADAGKDDSADEAKSYPEPTVESISVVHLRPRRGRARREAIRNGLEQMYNKAEKIGEKPRIAPAERTANLSARRSCSPKRNYGWPDDQKLTTCRKASTITSVKASESAASSYAMLGSRESASIASSIPSSPKNYSACSTANFRKVGTANCRNSPQTRKVWRLASPRRKC